jgi:hypothetical protein
VVAVKLHYRNLIQHHGHPQHLQAKENDNQGMQHHLLAAEAVDRACHDLYTQAMEHDGRPQAMHQFHDFHGIQHDLLAVQVDRRACPNLVRLSFDHQLPARHGIHWFWALIAQNLDPAAAAVVQYCFEHCCSTAWQSPHQSHLWSDA